MSKKTIQYAVVASVLFLITIGVFAYTMFQIEAKGNLLRDQIATLGAERSQEEAFYKLQRVAQESEGDRQQLLLHFLQHDSEAIDLLTRIETLAPTLGVVQKTEGIQRVTDKKTGLTWIDLNLSFSGEEANVDRFLRALEHLPYLLKITSLDLSAQSSSLWKAQLTLRVYVLTYDK